MRNEYYTTPCVVQVAEYVSTHLMTVTLHVLNPLQYSSFTSTSTNSPTAYFHWHNHRTHDSKNTTYSLKRINQKCKQKPRTPVFFYSYIQPLCIEIFTCLCACLKDNWLNIYCRGGYFEQNMEITTKLGLIHILESLKCRHGKERQCKCNFERVYSTVSDGLEKGQRLTRSSQKALDPMTIKRCLLSRGFI